MNRIIYTLFALLLTLRTAAQDLPVVSRVKVDFGPKLGINLSKLDGTSWDGGYKTNLLGGAFLSVHGNRFGVQVEGLFSQTTYITGKSFDSIYNSYIAAGQDSLNRGQFRLSQFNIPVMAQVRILSRVWLQVGAQYSGIVSVKSKEEFFEDAEKLFDKGSIAAIGGLWIDVTRRINVGARYVMGLSNINNKDFSDIPETWKQRDIQLHLGLTF